MRVRRLLISTLLLLAFVLGGSQVARQFVVATQAGHSELAMQTDMASLEHSTAAGCPMCAKDRADGPLCMATCVGGAVALPVDPYVPLVVALARLGIPAQEHVSGGAVRPDPHPPKPIPFIG